MEDSCKENRQCSDNKHILVSPQVLYHVFKIFLNLFLERGREGDREGEKYQCMVASRTPAVGDVACSPFMCPDWELH